jgi:hypothetical protein
MKWLICVVVMSGCALPQSIKVAPTPLNNLGFLYTRMPTEFAFCAYGEANDKSVNIRRIDLPFIYKATEDFVNFEPCTGRDYLGIGHSHPVGSECVFSDVDIHTLLEGKAPYGFLICEDKLVWYSKEAVARAMQDK